MSVQAAKFISSQNTKTYPEPAVTIIACCGNILTALKKGISNGEGEIYQPGIYLKYRERKKISLISY